MSHRPHRGFQLLELTISLTTASMLLAGLTASIVIASRASELASSRQTRSLRNSAALDRLRSDLAEAAPVLARSATSATLSIGDRNADGSPETIQYRWLGTGTPLQMSSNTGAWQSLTTDLESFQFGWQTCQPQSILPTPPALEPARSLVFQSRTLASNALPGRSLSIAIPSTFQTNDLLVLAIAVQGEQDGEIIAPAGWIKTGEETDSSDRVSLAVWYSLGPPSSSVNIGWKDSASCYATLAHFQVNGGPPALAGGDVDVGVSRRPRAPSADALANDSLVVRVLGARSVGAYGISSEAEATNMVEHLPIALRQSVPFVPLIFGSPAIIGMTYRHCSKGSTGSAEFNLPSNARYVAATLVFSP